LQLDRSDNDAGYYPWNCQFVTHQENSINRGIRKDNKSGYVGVLWHLRNKAWVSRITYKQVLHHIGSFDTVEQAVWARDFYIVSHKLPHRRQML